MNCKLIVAAIVVFFISLLGCGTPERVVGTDEVPAIVVKSALKTRSYRLSVNTASLLIVYINSRSITSKVVDAERLRLSRPFAFLKVGSNSYGFYNGFPDTMLMYGADDIIYQYRGDPIKRLFAIAQIIAYDDPLLGDNMANEAQDQLVGELLRLKNVAYSSPL